MPTQKATATHPIYTREEIYQQPALWPTTLTRVRAACEQQKVIAGLRGKGVLLTGAGSSAYAAGAVAAAWRGAIAVPSTDLLIDTDRYLDGIHAVVSLARSGDSPESAAVVARVRGLKPELQHVAITCNPDSALSRTGLDGHIILDPRSNDRSLVMTSSYSNLVLAGYALAQHGAASAAAMSGAERAAALLPEIENRCRRVAARIRDRVVILASAPLLDWAREAALKLMEMTAGRYTVVCESYLGLRHGPMSFLTADTVVLCLLSNDPLRQLYEVDLIHELQLKQLGFLVGISDPEQDAGLFDEVLPAVLPQAADELRTPFEIVAPQLLGYHLSLRTGLNPDNPSPEGVINRVVQGVRIHTMQPVS
jgi:tagatose-6-phosphate ketose/aldose isomerase